MAAVTRRGFIKRTSLSAAVIGALGAAVPTLSLADGPAPARTGPRLASGPDVPLAPTPLGGAPFIVYVSDPSTGAGTILVGEQAIPFTEGAIVQSLRQAIG